MNTEPERSELSTWYLNLHLEFKQQLRFWAIKENLHKVSFAAIYKQVKVVSSKDDINIEGHKDPYAHI